MLRVQARGAHPKPSFPTFLCGSRIWGLLVYLTASFWTLEQWLTPVGFALPVQILCLFHCFLSPGGGDVPAPSKGRCSARCWQSQPMLFWPAVRYMFLLIVLLIKSIDYFNGEKWNIIRCNLTALTSFQALTLMWKAKTTMDRSWKVTDTYTQLWTLDWEWGKK